MIAEVGSSTQWKLTLSCSAPAATLESDLRKPRTNGCPIFAPQPWALKWEGKKTTQPRKVNVLFTAVRSTG